ncbi:MAG TPA: type II toxin-antitoxin system VapC family toxin [Anaerolineales bacterium]|nr:type II toxin-antitoxin system VapC family toxin [Anaerolineales bacterium]HMR99548.1 type II toxin-antitoxin system VapC family toxin [Anaerolineales bacterium]HNQ94713.1 type II toxin-antitoxin system VapC family toxin [Anaerolineales bacterium]HNS59771.1 type II toxin-antitoxin system VapC family toxin [Anaerolineales bacterium]
MRHLDTNIVIAYLTGDQAVAKHIKDLLPEVAISSLVLAELRFGARASVRTDENLERLDQFLQIVEVVDFDDASADAYSRIRLSLRRMGRPTGEMDLLIASVALAHNAILITHNTKHFENIERLNIEDWLA